MLAVRPYVEKIETVGVELPVGGVGPADAERVSEVDAVAERAGEQVTCPSPALPLHISPKVSAGSRRRSSKAARRMEKLGRR